MLTQEAHLVLVAAAAVVVAAAAEDRRRSWSSESWPTGRRRASRQSPGPREAAAFEPKVKTLPCGSGETMIHKQVSLQSINVESGTWASFNYSSLPKVTDTQEGPCLKPIEILVYT